MTASLTSHQLMIEPMRHEHLYAISQIDKAVYPRPWSKALYLDELRQPHNRLYLVAQKLVAQKLVAQKTGRATDSTASTIAYGGLIAVADEGHISSIAVDPAEQGQGVGSWLLLALHQAVRDQHLPDGEPVGQAVKQISSMTLEVRASNRAAQSLYSRFGYAPVGTRPRYYRGQRGQDREDALIMWCHDIGSAEHGERLKRIAERL